MNISSKEQVVDCRLFALAVVACKGVRDGKQGSNLRSISNVGDVKSTGNQQGTKSEKIKNAICLRHKSSLDEKMGSIYVRD